MAEQVTLSDAVKGFDADSYAILYAPKRCRLTLFDGVRFIDEHKTAIDVSDVFEVRVFNADKELRWVQEAGGKGRSRIISDACFPDAIQPALKQKYLLWGKKNDNPANGFTQFAEARIGAFYVPKEIATDYAQFCVVEYLREYDDGNIAVMDERLTGISEV
jgi:CRISPR-associated protein (TIGR03984 family)